MCLCYLGQNTFEELGRLFPRNKINDGRSIEPCGTRHLISFFTVLVYSGLFYTVYYHLSNWQTKQDLWY